MPPILAATPAPGLWRATPPAIFPPILGLLGLGLAWRRAGAVFGFGPALSDLVLGGVTLLALFAFVAYAAKLARRPAVVVEDLRVLPGRSGLVALSMSVLLLAAVAVAYSLGAARFLLWTGLALQAGIAMLILRGFVSGPPEQRRVTPVWHLSFVGFILAPLSAIPVGFTLLSEVIFWSTLGAAAFIWAASVAQFLRADVPAPLRPLLAIHLAPASLFATVAASLHLPLIAEAFGLVALGLALVLTGSLRWLTVAGFSAMWGSFTFPMAAFASAALSLAAGSSGSFWRAAGAIALLAASLAIPVIAVKVLQLWARGQLGPRTNAASA